MLAQAFAAWLMTVATSRGVGEGISCLPPWKHKHCVEKKALALHCSSPHFNPHAKHSATTRMTNHGNAAWCICLQRCFIQLGPPGSQLLCTRTSPRILKSSHWEFSQMQTFHLFWQYAFFQEESLLNFFFFLCSPALLLTWLQRGFQASTWRKQ